MSPESWLNECGRLLAEGRRAESAIAIATALETALASCIRATLVERPDQQRALPAEIEMLHKRYNTSIGRMPLGSLQNLAIHLVIRRERPQTIAQALDVIEQSKQYANRVPPAEQFAVKDAETRKAIEALRDASIIALRGAVMHQAYVPSEEEIAQQRDATADLVRAISAAFAV